MADVPDCDTGGKTPLELAYTPSLDRLAAAGRTGLICTVPPGHYAGSENAILTILGYPPEALPHGRGYLESVGAALRLPTPYTPVARYRINRQATTIEQLGNKDTDLVFYPLNSSAGLVYNRYGLSPVSRNPDIVLWSADHKRAYVPFPPFHSDRTVKPRCVMIGAIPLVKGIAAATGMEWISPRGATGDTSTDYKAKAGAAVRCLETYDIVILHIEACDYASHARDLKAKVTAIENIDKFVIEPLSVFLDTSPTPFRIVVLPDHLSLWKKGEHADGSVPVLIYDPSGYPDNTSCYSERAAAGGSVTDISILYSLYG